MEGSALSALKGRTHLLSLLQMAPLFPCDAELGESCRELFISTVLSDSADLHDARLTPQPPNTGSACSKASVLTLCAFLLYLLLQPFDCSTAVVLRYL